MSRSVVTTDQRAPSAHSDQDATPQPIGITRLAGQQLGTREVELLRRAADGLPPRNDTDVAGPGTVLVDLEQPRRDGDVTELSDQVDLCYVRSAGTWRLVSVRLNSSCDSESG